MNIPLIDLHAQYLDQKREIDKAIKGVITNSEFINGSANKAFDNNFAKYCGVKYSIGVSSGSSALDYALEALGVGKGDEVICPAHTFTATAEAIMHVGAKPVFADIEENSYNIDPRDVDKKVTQKTKAIIAVHLYGLPAKVDEISTICKKHNLYLIEDAAQAHGACYKGKKVGGFGDIAIFSFFPAKNLGCFGDGGAVTTNDVKLAEKVKMLKDHGRVSKYKHLEIGYGGRLDNLQAAVLNVKLDKLDLWNKKRRDIAKRYTETLNGVYITPKEPDYATSVFYVYTLRHPEREEILVKLKKRKIATGVYYPHPLHLQKAYEHLGYKEGDLPITEKVCKEIFSIPIHPHLTDKQQNQIISALIEHSG